MTIPLSPRFFHDFSHFIPGFSQRFRQDLALGLPRALAPQHLAELRRQENLLPGSLPSYLQEVLGRPRRVPWWLLVEWWENGPWWLKSGKIDEDGGGEAVEIHVETHVEEKTDILIKHLRTLRYDFKMKWRDDARLILTWLNMIQSNACL